MYGEDLAHIHDAAYSGFARGAGEQVLDLLRRRGPRPSADPPLVIDLGCGSGVWAAQLLRAGYAVQGVDISDALLRLARQNAPGAVFRRGSAHDAVLPRCDAVTALGEVLGYCDAAGKRPPLRRLFKRVFAALKPRGLFVFDLIEADGPSLSGKSWAEHPDWAVLVEVAEQPSSRALRREIVTFMRRGSHYRRREESHKVRLELKREVLDALRSVGFKASASKRYGEYQLLPRRVAFVAHKPAGAR